MTIFGTSLTNIPPVLLHSHD